MIYRSLLYGSPEVLQDYSSFKVSQDHALL